jgi:hypothetical protein
MIRQAVSQQVLYLEEALMNSQWVAELQSVLKMRNAESEVLE